MAATNGTATGQGSSDLSGAARGPVTSRPKSAHKVVSLEEAASFVRDGDTVGIGGSTMSRTPMGMIWALIRAGRKGLTCSRSIVSSDGDLLLASGACGHIVTSWFSQSILWGVSKVMRHHVETGKARYDEWSHMAMGMRFRAGAMGDSVHADPIDAGIGCAKAAPRGDRDGLPVHRREDPAGSGAQSRRRLDPRPALRSLTETRRSTGCSSWTSIWPSPPTRLS